VESIIPISATGKYVPSTGAPFLLPSPFPSLQLRVCRCWALSLTRERVYRLQLLLALASVVILWSESSGTRDHILLSQIRDFPFRRFLRLAGSRWRYSTPPVNGISCLWTSLFSLICAWTRIEQKTYPQLLLVLSLPGKQRIYRSVPQQRLVYCGLFTQLLFGNAFMCRSIF
jgi:hypothetical protein